MTAGAGTVGAVHAHPPGALRVADVADASPIVVSLVLRPAQAALTRHVSLISRSVRPPRMLSWRDVERRFGFPDNDLEELRGFAARHRLTLGERDPISGTVAVSGSAENIQRALSIQLSEYVCSVNGSPVRYRTYDGAVQLPPEVAATVEGVVGLSTRPFAHPHIIRAPAPGPEAVGQSFAATDIARAYGIPAGAKATHQRIGIIELDGGYVPKQITEYCRQSGIPRPIINDISVDGARNSPTKNGAVDTADSEVALDIQIAATVAPGAELNVYFAPNTDKGFIDAVAQAVKDGCTAVSISWGAAEDDWTPSTRRAFDRACQVAITMGISVFAAAGDNGYTDGVTDGRAHTDFPATSPHVVACGGTKLPNLDRAKETTWNDPDAATGGGVSDYFPRPGFQHGVALPRNLNDGQRRRTVPDISGNAAPTTGWRIYLNGAWYSFGGTSAVAPMMAGMHALLAEAAQVVRPGTRLRDFNSMLYGRWAKHGGVRPINDGSGNGPGGSGYRTPGPGQPPAYNAAVGWGTPNFDVMLRLMLADLGVTSSTPIPNPPVTKPVVGVDGVAA